MSKKENQYRYKIDQTKYVDSLYADTFKDATEAAHKLVESDGTAPVTIHDRRARVGKPETYTVTKCTGEAHRNPFIDNCMVCAPNWEIVVRPKDIKILKAGQDDNIPSGDFWMTGDKFIGL